MDLQALLTKSVHESPEGLIFLLPNIYQGDYGQVMWPTFSKLGAEF